MKLSEAMTRDVRVANPDQSIREAAQLTKARRLSARPFPASRSQPAIVR